MTGQVGTINNKIPLLLIGQVPPPWHGQAVATQLLFDHDWPGFEVTRLPMRYSNTLDRVGKAHFFKIWHLFGLIFQARKIISARKDTLILYPPASPRWLPFLRDVAFLTAIGCKRENKIFIFHASGLAEFVSKSIPRKFLANLVYGGAKLSLETSVEERSPNESFCIDKWMYCPCGVEVPTAISESNPREKNELVVLFVGTLCEEKGVFDIVEVARRLQKSGRNEFKFRLVGAWESKKFKKRVMKRLKELDLVSSVIFPGPATGEDKWQEYRNADIFLVPTHYPFESSPLVVMEALGMGLPLITTQWAGIPTMLKGCQTCITLPISSPDLYADALVKIKEGELGDNISGKSREFYEKNFAPDVFLSRIEQGCKVAWGN